MIGQASSSFVEIQTHKKIMLVGDYVWPWYQEACAEALESLGHEVIRFGWFDDFRRWIENRSEPVYHSAFHHIQHRIHQGPTVWRVNKRLLRIAREMVPDIVWFYNVQLISANSVKAMRRVLPKAIFCQYANDNPFSKTASASLWKNYLASVKYFDIHFSYRNNNIMDYQRIGVKNIYLLRSYFIPESDYPISPNQIAERFKCDVVFAGHYENDGRVEMLEAICEAGFKLGLFGGGWNSILDKLKPNSPLRALYPIHPVTDADYRQAICGAKVALCFLSTLNRDTYTRRCFQIPAMRKAMLAQYTDDLCSLFRPDVDAMFFRDRNEMLSKLACLVDNKELREQIAESGYRRVYADRHDVRGRMAIMMDEIIKWQTT